MASRAGQISRGGSEAAAEEIGDSNRWSHRYAAAELLPLVYDELRKLAAAKMATESPGQTLDATELVHEAYLRLTGKQAFESRSHFMRAAAEGMRRILVDHARQRNAAKRGGGKRVAFAEERAQADEPDADLVALHEALTRLAALQPKVAELVQLRYFAGLTIAEAAALLEIAPRTADAFPAVLAYQVELGGNYCNFGNLVRGEGKLADSLPLFALAIRTLTQVHEKEPREVTARLFLRNSHLGRAVSLDQLKKHAEAVKDWDRVVAHSPPVERPFFLAHRATSRVQAGQVNEAVAEVAELTKSSRWSADQWYDFACVYAIASGKSADKKQAHADRAMELLHQAVKAGYKDAAHMKKDTDLDALRDREDFKNLIAELEAKAPKK